MSTYNLPTDKIPDQLKEVIRDIQEILGDQAYDFMLIGATARDLILDGQYHLGAGPKTLDVDFALYVPEWGVYQSVLDKLLKSGLFTATKVTHKLIYKEICEIDIVPFGEIQNEEGEYDWPPDFMRSMNVAGFMEVREETITFKIDEEDLTFSVAPIHAIYFMKIYAWNDRKYKDDKDGRDQGFILANYIELKYEVLYDEHEDIFNGEDWDIINSCARILGRDIAKLLKNNPKAIQKTILIIENELEDEEHSYLARSLSAGGGFDYNRAYKALQELLKGIRDLHD